MPKVFLSYAQQISNLKSKNLLIDDESYAEEVLSRIGYFPLIVAYKNSFKNPTTQQYRDGITLRDIVALYRFDEVLRFDILRQLLRFERSIKTQMAYMFCAHFGDNQKEYLSNANYNYTGIKKSGIDYLISNYLKPLAITSDNQPYIVHHRKTHNNVPLWVLINALTFGNISTMFSYYPQTLQSKICKSYPLLPHEMEKILSVLTKFRNVCAHGERLFQYRTMNSIPDLRLHSSLGISKKGTEYTCGKRDLFALLIALRYIMPSEDFKELNSDISKNMAVFTSDCVGISENELLDQMGFPHNWKKLTSYKLR